MAYATQADIMAVYGEDALVIVADRAGDGEIDAAAVNQALAAATSLIDAHVGVRYMTPLATVPDLVRDLCIDITLYKLATEGNGLTEEKRTRYEDALSLLKRIADGKANLDLPLPEARPKSAGAVIVSSQPRQFGRDRMRGF